MPWLERELALIRPRLVVPLGRHALEALRADGEDRRGPRARAGVGGRELFPLYHPAAAMYNQTLRATLFEDAARRYTPSSSSERCSSAASR